MLFLMALKIMSALSQRERATEPLPTSAKAVFPNPHYLRHTTLHVLDIALH